MSLLKKFIAGTKELGNREIAHVTLLAITGFASVLVNDEPKERISITFSDGTDVRSAIMFKDGVRGLPTFIPKAGMNAQIVLQESTEINPTTKEPWINVISMGVEA